MIQAWESAEGTGHRWLVRIQQTSDGKTGTFFTTARAVRLKATGLPGLAVIRHLMTEPFSVQWDGSTIWKDRGPFWQIRLTQKPQAIVPVDGGTVEPRNVAQLRQNAGVSSESLSGTWTVEDENVLYVHLAGNDLVFSLIRDLDA